MKIQKEYLELIMMQGLQAIWLAGQNSTTPDFRKMCKDAVKWGEKFQKFILKKEVI